MALQHLRSSTAHKRPIPTVMSAGQIAINTNQASPGLFFKDSNGDLVKVGPVHIGTSAPNSSPDSVAATALVTGTVYQILTVGTSDFTLVGASANTVGTVFTATGTTTGTGTVSGQQGNEKGEQWLDTTGGAYDLKIYDGTSWRSQAGEFVNVTGDTMTGALLLDNAASASAPDLSFDGDANTGIYSPGADQVAISTGGTGRLFVDASGNVGVGTSSPYSITGANILSVHNSSGSSEINFLSSTTGFGALYFGDATSGSGSYAGYLEYKHGDDYMRIATGSTERLRIDSSGRLLVGTSTPGDAAADNLTLSSSGDTGITIRASETDSSSIYFADGAGGTNVYTGAIIYDHATNHMSIHTNSGTEQTRIDSSGNLLFRQESASSPHPEQKLKWSNDSTTANGFYISQDTSRNGRVWHEQGLEILFGTNNAERMRLDASGRLLIGTSSARTIATQSLAIQNEGTSFGTTGFSTCRNSNDVYGPYIHFGKSRGTSVGSNTIVSSGDDLGGLIFGGADGNDVDHQAAYIICQVDGATGANNIPGRLSFFTTANGAPGPTERLRIDANGRLTQATDTYNFTTVDAANMSISSTGNIRRSTSSLRYKTNVETMEDVYADNILNVRPVWYRSTCEDDNPSYGYWGFIAEEVSEIDPRLCFYSQDENENQQVDGVAYDRFVPHLLNLIKRQQQAIETLEAKVAALEAS